MVARAMSSLTSRPLPSTITSGRSRDYAQVQRPRVALVYQPSTGCLRSHDHPDLFDRPWRPGQARCDP